MINVKDHEVNEGDLILPSWEKLLDSFSTDEVSFGPGLLVQHFPGEAIHVRALDDPVVLVHPWRFGGLSDGTALIRMGTLSGQFPWLKDGRLGAEGKTYGEIEVKKVPTTGIFVALGVADSVEDINEELTAEEFKVSTITTLPPGLGSGGVIPVAGWWWYPLIKLWMDEEERLQYHQIVHFNLNFGREQRVNDDDDTLPNRAYFWGA